MEDASSQAAFSDAFKFEYRGRGFIVYSWSNGDFIYQQIKQAGHFYEQDLLQYLTNYYQDEKPDLCLDIGANIGNHSMYFSAMLAPSVISFEPNPVLFPVLKRNITENNLPVNAFNVGLGDHASRAIVEVPERFAMNYGAGRIVETKQAEEATCEVVTLDSFMVDHAPLFDRDISKILVKIDVEGMEPAVIRGAAQFLKRFQPDLLVEAVDQWALDDLQKALAGYDYHILSRWCGTPVYHMVMNPTKRSQSLARSLEKRHHRQVFKARVKRKLKKEWNKLTGRVS